MRTILCSLLIILSVAAQGQKSLQLKPGVPGFLRNGDRLELQLSITNSGNTDQTGKVELQLTDAATGISVDGWFQNVFPNQYFTAEKGSGTVARFPVAVPYTFFKTAAWRFIVRTATDSVVRTGVLPVRPLLERFTRTALFRGSGNHTFLPLTESASSETLLHDGLTVSTTASPVALVLPDLVHVAFQPDTTPSANADALLAAGLLLHAGKSQAAARQLVSTAGWDKAASERLNLLSRQQLSDGSFGAADVATTWLIAVNTARLLYLKALPEPETLKLQIVVRKALSFLHQSAQPVPTVALAYIETLAGLPLSAPREQQWVTTALGGQALGIQALTAAFLAHTNKMELARQVLRLAAPNNIAKDDLLTPALSTALLLEAAQRSADTASMYHHLQTLLDRKGRHGWQERGIANGLAYALLPNTPVMSLPTGAINIGSLPPRAFAAGTYRWDTTLDGSIIGPALGTINVRSDGSRPLLTWLQWHYFDEPTIGYQPTAVFTRKWALIKGGRTQPLEALMVKAGDSLLMTIELKVDAPLEKTVLSCDLPAGFGLIGYSNDLGPKATSLTNAQVGNLEWMLPTLEKGRYTIQCRLVATTAGRFGSGNSSLRSWPSRQISGWLSSEEVWVEE